MIDTARRGRLAWQTLALFVILAVLALLVYGDHVRDGGWVGDAWVTRAWYVLYPHTNFFETVNHFLDLDSMAPRPGNAVYRVALNEWLGADTSAWFAWQAISCVCMCMALYALLRELGLPYLDAAAVAALLLVFPAAASLWLWSPIVHASLTITLASVGFLLALRAFRATGRKRWLLHGASLLLFVLSLLLYEICLPVFLASFLLYALRAPRREALRRWLVDCLVLLPLALAISASTEAQDQGVSGAIAHAGEIASQLPTLLFDRLLPLGSVEILAALALAAVYGLGWLALRRLPTAHPQRGRLRLLFVLTSAGFVVIVLGYAIYIPGLDYYQPLAAGIGDRVNVVAAIGWVLVLYALLGLVATLASVGLRLAPLYAELGTAALAVGLGVSWLSPIADESRAYIDAHAEGDRMLDVVERAVPRPQKHAAIWTFGQPAEVAAGVPVFANYWNMSAAGALLYHDPTVRSFVAFTGTEFKCTPRGVVPTGHFEYPLPPPGKLGEFGSRYGRTYFVDTVRGQFAMIETRRQCLELRDAFPRSPALPSAALPRP